MPKLVQDRVVREVQNLPREIAVLEQVYTQNVRNLRSGVVNPRNGLLTSTTVHQDLRDLREVINQNKRRLKEARLEIEYRRMMLLP